MKRVVRAFVGVAALGAIAFGASGASADGIPRGREAVPVYAGPYDWSGWYIGANAGWMRSDFDWAFHPPIAGAANQAFSLSDDSGIYGAQLGIQHQWGNFVVGIEAAASGSNSRARHDGFGLGAAAFAEAALENLYTVGGRIGWAADRWLLYVDGGYANGLISTGNPLKTTGVRTVTSLERHDGWYLGAGVEYAVTRNWIFGVEYQHVDLDTKFHCTNIAALSSGGCASDTNNHDIDASADIIRARLSFKFGREAREVVPLK